MPPTSTTARAGGFDATLQRARRVQAGKASRSPASLAPRLACFGIRSIEKLVDTILFSSLTLQRRFAGKIEGEGGRRAQARAAHQADSIWRVGCNSIFSGQLILTHLRRTKYHRLHVHDALLCKVHSGRDRVRPAHGPCCPLSRSHFSCGRPEFRRVKSPDIYGQ